MPYPRRQHRLSIILSTHNRRDVVSQTLERLHQLEIPRRDLQVIVVDNASADGTRDAIQSLADLVIPLRRNAGSCAKAYGVDQAIGEFVLFLDDDSSPWSGSLTRMLSHFDGDPGLGAAGFSVHLPEGGQECSALPNVFVGCGVGFRASALKEVGGLDRTFFMQAEEYDLSFRLAGAGWNVRVFDDLHVDHLKTEQARRPARTTYYDIRNNLRVLARYLPAPYYQPYRADTILRYAWLAQREGNRRAYRQGLWSGMVLGAKERWTYRSRRLSTDTFESFYSCDFLRRRMEELARGGVRSVIFATLGKNLYAFHQAAAHADINVLAIADDRFAAPNRAYRGIAVIPLQQALQLDADAIVVSDSAGIFARQTSDRLRQETARPVHDWFGHVPTATEAAFNSTSPRQRPMIPCAAGFPDVRRGAMTP